MVERYERAQQQEEEGYRRRQQQGVGFCATGLLELALTKTQPDPAEGSLTGGFSPACVHIAAAWNR
jgi:hypothetical protein